MRLLIWSSIVLALLARPAAADCWSSSVTREVAGVADDGGFVTWQRVEHQGLGASSTVQLHAPTGAALVSWSFGKDGPDDEGPDRWTVTGGAPADAALVGGAPSPRALLARVVERAHAVGRLLFSTIAITTSGDPDQGEAEVVRAGKATLVSFPPPLDGGSSPRWRVQLLESPRARVLFLRRRFARGGRCHQAVDEVMWVDRARLDPDDIGAAREACGAVHDGLERERCWLALGGEAVLGDMIAEQQGQDVASDASIARAAGIIAARSSYAPLAAAAAAGAPARRFAIAALGQVVAVLGAGDGRGPAADPGRRAEWLPEISKLCAAAAHEPDAGLRVLGAACLAEAQRPAAPLADPEEPGRCAIEPACRGEVLGVAASGEFAYRQDRDGRVRIDVHARDGRRTFQLERCDARPQDGDVCEAFNHHWRVSGAHDPALEALITGDPTAEVLIERLRALRRLTPLAAAPVKVTIDDDKVRFGLAVLGAAPRGARAVTPLQHPRSPLLFLAFSAPSCRRGGCREASWIDRATLAANDLDVQIAMCMAGEHTARASCLADIPDERALDAILKLDLLHDETFDMTSAAAAYLALRTSDRRLRAWATAAAPLQRSFGLRSLAAYVDALDRDGPTFGLPPRPAAFVARARREIGALCRTALTDANEDAVTAAYGCAAATDLALPKAQLLDEVTGSAHPNRRMAAFTLLRARRDLGDADWRRIADVLATAHHADAWSESRYDAQICRALTARLKPTDTWAIPLAEAVVKRSDVPADKADCQQLATHLSGGPRGP